MNDDTFYSHHQWEAIFCIISVLPFTINKYYNITIITNTKYDNIEKGTSKIIFIYRINGKGFSRNHKAHN
jgi:hypothetical protein